MTRAFRLSAGLLLATTLFVGSERAVCRESLCRFLTVYDEVGKTDKELGFVERVAFSLALARAGQPGTNTAHSM
jgi:hypothetical protein